MSERLSLWLLDLPILFRARWHASEHEEIGAAYMQTLSAVRGYVAGCDHAAVCVDMPPYIRQQLAPTYKAHREKASGAMMEQYERLKEQLARDGMWVVGAHGYEADDIIATLAAAHRGKHDITIVSGDKDLLALVGDGVVVMQPATGAVLDEAAVVAKYGVLPSQIPDWLAIVGDDSDGIPGIKGAGPKKATAWLQKYGDIAGLFDAVGSIEPERFNDIIFANDATIKTAKVLATLYTNAPIDTAALFEEREVTHMEPETKEPVPAGDPEPAEEMAEPTVEMMRPQPQGEMPRPSSTALEVASPGGAVAAGARPWELRLEPGNIDQAWWLAQVLHRAKIFGDYGSAESVLGTIMTGRLYHLDAVTSLRSFHVIKGKQVMSASLMVAIILRSAVCEYFRLVESTAKVATWEAKRVGDPPVRMSFTIEEAQAAGLVKPGSNWTARPKTMLRHRAATELARALFPDVVAGLYSIEEMEDAA